MGGALGPDSHLRSHKNPSAEGRERLPGGEKSHQAVENVEESGS